MHEVRAHTEPAAATPQTHPFARWPVLGVAAAGVAVLLAVGTRYGYHRDELYFLATARHLTWGFVDQPPFVPSLAWLSHAVFGDWLGGLRLLPALAYGATVVLTARIAREFGAARFGQILAALCAATAGVYLGESHLLSTTPFDLLFWVLVSYVVVRIIRTGNDRLWLAVGVVVGVALWDKFTIGFLLIGLGAGFLLNGEARRFRSPWLWAGAATALVMWSPDLVWQAAHGWPTVEMFRSLQREHSGLGDTLKFVPAQILYMGPLIAPIWIAGLVRLLKTEEAKPYRAFAWAWVVLFVLIGVFMGDKPYYLSPLYAVLFAAGAVATERWLERRNEGRRAVHPGHVLLVAVAAVGLIGVPLALPVLPATTLHGVPLQTINYDLGEQIGWPRYTAEIARVWHAIPPAERAHAVVLTANYGEAGAIDRFGGELGLPPAYSGHNAYRFWGPPPTPVGRTVWVGFDPGPYVNRFCSAPAVLVTRLHNAEGVDDDEQDAPVLECTMKPTLNWSAVWPELKHYG
jgi:hypothetical protein